jgi:cyclase
MRVLDTVEGYIGFVLDTARAALDDGLSPLEAARAADLGEYAALSDGERIVGNLHRAMYELGEPDAPEQLDLAAAIGDMLTYNGGKPLRCVA